MNIAASSVATSHPTASHSASIDDLVARIIWRMVAAAGERDDRSLYLLAGLTPGQLAALSRSFPSSGRFTLAIDPEIDAAVLGSLPEDHLSRIPAVRRRNLAAYGAVLMAVRDEERNSVGQSLGAVETINPSAIQACYDLWGKEVAEAESATLADTKKVFIRAMIAGLDRSGVVKNLEQFAAVIIGFMSQPELPFQVRLRRTATILHLPLNCYGNVPNPETGANVDPEAFRTMFARAESEHRNIPYLRLPDERRMDADAILTRLSELRAMPDHDKERESALAIVDALIADRKNLRAGEWRASQQRFCKEFDYGHYGKEVFQQKARKEAKRLGDRTRHFLEKEHADYIDDTDREILTAMDAEDEGTSGKKKEGVAATADAIKEFFERRHDILTQDRRLFAEWRQRIFPAVIQQQPDLLLALLQGAHMAVERAVPASGPIPLGVRFRLGAKGASKESTWTSLDKRVYTLFRLEMQLVAGGFGDLFDLDLGLWLDPDAIAAKKADSSDARTIELEIAAIVPGDEKPGPKVRILWNPCPTAKRSIALALPEDIEAILAVRDGGLIRLMSERIHPVGSGDDSAMSLLNTSSFGDVRRDGDGRTANPAAGSPHEEWFASIASEITGLASMSAIKPEVCDVLTSTLSDFRSTLTEALVSVSETPADCYQSEAIPKAADAFGELCRLARQHLTGDSAIRSTTLRRICEFGLAISSSQVPIAILPAWHPLRLLERRTRTLTVAQVLRSACGDSLTTSEGLRNEVQDYARALTDWHYGDVLSVSLNSYVCVENFAGYGLAVSMTQASRTTQALEVSARAASEQFMRMAKEYLALHPHEESNFATAIYNAESVELPRLLAGSLEDLMDDRKNLRCGLLITHDSAERVRRIYTHQNTRLQGRGGRGDGAFLSRLRVGVRSGNDVPGSYSRPDVDVAFLHEVFSRQAEEIGWEMVDGVSEDLSRYVDLRSALRPKRRMFTGSMSASDGLAERLKLVLQIDDLPRAVAQFTDLCFCTHKKPQHIPEGKRAAPIREIVWGDKDSQVQRIIKHAHRLAEWVVSYDTLSNRAMLVRAGINVIRDVAIPGTDARLLVSSHEPSRNLRRSLRTTLAAMAPADLAIRAEDVAAEILDTVVEVCGQKVMAAGRSVNAALEILGLAAATKLVCLAPETAGRPLVWVSLDDSRATLDLTGKLADTLAVAVGRDEHGGFTADLTVVEAKCVGQASLHDFKAKSAAQAKATCGALDEKLVSQTDPAARRTWGGRLLRLLLAKPELDRALGSPVERKAFDAALTEGQVALRIHGRSVVVVHDDAIMPPDFDHEVTSEAPFVVQHVVGQRGLASLFAKSEGSMPPSIPPLRTQGGFSAGDTKSGNVKDHGPGHTGHAGFGTSEAPFGKGATGPIRPDARESGVHDALAKRNADLDGEGSASGTVDKENDPAADLNSSFPPALADRLRDIATASMSPEEAVASSLAAETVAKRLQSALAGFGMKAAFAPDYLTETPNGVIVRFRGDDLLTVKKIEARLPELRTTHGLDVVRVLGGLGEISIFVASSKRQVVDLARTWLEATWPATAPDSLTSFLVGVREDNGQPLWLNLDKPFGGNVEHAPHTLIAGETGSGKGVLTQSLLLQMVALNHPRNLRIRLIDPKQGVDFFWIEDAPHLEGGIVATQDEAEKCLNELVAEMDRRYSLLVARKVPNIREFNAKAPEDERLPRIVVVHDEMADWMAGSKEYREMIQGTMTRLAAKARACGIHLIMITQRAAQDAIPVGIRDNLGNRLVLKVASEAGSVLALKSSGAERLLGKGHVAASLSGDKPSDGDYFIAQTPFASTDDLTALGRTAIASWEE